MKATGAEPRAARSSGNKRPTPTADSFALSGPSELPDPAFNAYRRDLADVALAGRVIASHFADPVERVVTTQTSLQAGGSGEAETVGQLQAGEPFLLLDDALGWAWGYAGAERRVGYVRSDVLAKP